MNDATVKRINIGEYGLDICYQTISEGEVIESSSDRVGITSGSAYGSVTSNIRSHSGHVNGNVSSTWSFNVHTSVDVRHEFWIKCADGRDRQFVMPTHLPLIKGQKVSLRQVYFKYEMDADPQILAIELINFNTQQTHHYSLMGGGFQNCTLSEINNNLMLVLISKHPSIRNEEVKIGEKEEYPVNAYIKKYKDVMLMNSSKLHKILFSATIFVLLVIFSFTCGYIISDNSSRHKSIIWNILMGGLCAFITVGLYAMLAEFMIRFVDVLYEFVPGGFQKKKERWNDNFREPVKNAGEFILNQLSSTTFDTKPKG